MTVLTEFFAQLWSAAQAGSYHGRLGLSGTPRKTRAFRVRGEPPESRTSIRMLVKACNRGYEPPQPTLECRRRYGLT